MMTSKYFFYLALRPSWIYQPIQTLETYSESRCWMVYSYYARRSPYEIWFHDRHVIKATVMMTELRCCPVKLDDLKIT